MSRQAQDPPGFPFSRLREKVPKGRMRVLLQPHPSRRRGNTDSFASIEPHPHPAFGHPHPQGGRGGKLGTACPILIM